MTIVGLVQINNSFAQANYLPLSVGLLQAYAQANCRNSESLQFLPAVYCRKSVAESVQDLISADIVGFSAYVWNVEISTAIARQLKAQRPEILIVFGGPQVPDRAEEFLRQHPYVDVVVHGEGEVVFSRLLESMSSPDPRSVWPDIASLSYLQDHQYVQNPKAVRLKDLNQIPSPFLSGVFDELIKSQVDQQWLGLWETNRGCPFSCTFCDWGSATQAKVYQFELARLYQEISWFAQHKIEFVFCCDANFGILPRDLEIAEEVARLKAETGYPQALSVQNTKNATERAYQVQKKLAVAGLNKGVTLSMQSLDTLTLKNIRRDNISLDSYQTLQQRFTQDRIETYSDMILGLPGETYDSFVDGVAQIITNGQHNRIQFNNLAILPNAEMGDPAYQKRYGMETVVTRIVNFHGSLNEHPDGIYEKQDLVIATASMPRADWVRTRAFSWMTAFLYFDKIFQLPILLAHQIHSLPFRDLLACFANFDRQRFPVLHQLERMFEAQALAIQNGAPEYIHSKEWLDIYWPADEFALITLAHQDKLGAFYQEAEEVLRDFLHSRQIGDQEEIVRQASLLNQSLLKRPFLSENISLNLTFNLWEIYREALVGQSVPLRKGEWTHQIDRTSQQWHSWSDWTREVVWYGNKKGAYLYSNLILEHQFEGHF